MQSSGVWPGMLHAERQRSGGVFVYSVQRRSRWLLCLGVGMVVCSQAWWNKRATQGNVSIQKRRNTLGGKVWAIWLDQEIWGLNGCITLILQGAEFHFLWEILPTLYLLSCSKFLELNSVSRPHWSCHSTESHFIGRVEKSGKIKLFT